MEPTVKWYKLGLENDVLFFQTSMRISCELVRGHSGHSMVTLASWADMPSKNRSPWWSCRDPLGDIRIQWVFYWVSYMILLGLMRFMWGSWGLIDCLGRKPWCLVCSHNQLLCTRSDWPQSPWLNSQIGHRMMGKWSSKPWGASSGVFPMFKTNLIFSISFP